MHYQIAYFSRRILMYKNKNQSRSLANLNEVLKKNNMVMAGVNIFEMR